MLYDLYKADLTSRSERTSQGITRDLNVPPVTEIGGEIDDETTATDVSIVTMTPAIPLETKVAMISTTTTKTR